MVELGLDLRTHVSSSLYLPSHFDDSTAFPPQLLTLDTVYVSYPQFPQLLYEELEWNVRSFN